MKTRMNQLVAALFFAVIVIGNVNANEHKLDASSHENNQETLLEFENWMIDAEVWDVHSEGMFAETAEADLEVENWMTNKIVWEVESGNLEIENWMINANIWEVEKEFTSTTEDDQELKLESWMIDENIF